MADKKVPLSIVLRTVDRASAGINAVAKQLKAAAKPFDDLREAFGKLGQGAGLDKMREAFGGLGSAIGDALGKVLLIAGAIGAAVLALKSMVDEFDDLGDTAEKLGVGVDALAGLRYAAKRSGAEFADLDSGMLAFSQSLGQARAGTGKMKGFLEKASKPLLRQLLATKSNEEAFLLLADAMAKVKDPAKRAALAAKTVGNAALAPLLAKGSKGVGELTDRFKENAGSLEGAAGAAGEAADAMDDLDAAILGAKGALVKGLGPALTKLLEQLRGWFAENRERLAQWAADLGSKLPAAIEKMAEVFRGALDDVGDFVESIGGVKVVAIALAAIIAGPLIGAVVALGVAILTTPIGWILAGLAGLVLAAKEIAGGWEPLGDFFKGLWDRIVRVFQAAWDLIGPIVSKVVGAVSTINDLAGDVLDFINPLNQLRKLGEGGGTVFSPSQFVAAAQRARDSRTMIDVNFANAPKGMRATAAPTIGETIVNLNLGHQLGNMP
jgi:phage-related minor tail protein